MTTQNDFVAEKLAIQGRTRCDGEMEEWRGMDRYWKCSKCNLQSGGDFLHTPHWKDGKRPPDLLSDTGFKMLVEALWKRGFDVWFTTRRVEIWKRMSADLVAFEPIIGGNLPAALLEAAYDILMKEK
jgi:hypothetical protein